MAAGEELQIIDVTDITVHREPEKVLAEAQRAARVLKDVIDAKDHKVMMGGEVYLEVEDWATLARFYGITASVVSDSVQFVTYGNISGFTATAEAILVGNGQVISRATADCLNDEPKWATRAVYEWRDNGANGRERIKIGDEPVPLFQLKSMAQTRATAKVLRQILSWVVVLAGYKATPAEELDGQTTRVDTKGNGAAGPATTSAATGSTPATAAAATVRVPCKVKATRAGVPDKNKPGSVTMEDGRDGTTFDTKIIEEASRIKAKGGLAKAVFESVEKKGRVYTNIVSIEEVAADVVDTEPVGEPEQVRTSVKKEPAGHSPYWTIETGVRKYVTPNALWGGMAEVLAGLNPKGCAIIKFRTVKNAAGTAFNEILTFEEEAQAPKLEPVPAEGSPAAGPAEEAPLFSQTT